MQLLKLTQNYNASKQPKSKINPRNTLLNILQTCVHVPKDDRLLLRKYLLSLHPDELTENNEIIVILNKYSKKEKLKIKDTIDKKLEVLLRKFADRLRKQEQWFVIINKQQQNINNNYKAPQKKVQINPSKYCNNFQILKSSIRNHSSSKNMNRSQAISRQHSGQKQKFKQRYPLGEITFKSRVNENIHSLNQSKQKQSKGRSKKINNLRSILYSNKLVLSKRFNKLFLKTQHRQQQIRKSGSSSSLKEVYSYKSRNKGSQQYSRDMNIDLNKLKGKQPTQRFEYYNKGSNNYFYQLQQYVDYEQTNPPQNQLQYYIYSSQQQANKNIRQQPMRGRKFKHKQTKSRSLGDIIRHSNQQIIQIDVQNTQPNRFQNKPYQPYLNFNNNDCDNQNLVQNLAHQISFKFNSNMVNNSFQGSQCNQYKSNNYTTADNQYSYEQKPNSIFNSLNGINIPDSNFFINNHNCQNPAYATRNNSMYNSATNSNYNSIQNTPSYTNPYPKMQPSLQQCSKLAPLPQNLQLNNTSSSVSLSFTLSNFNTFNSHYSSIQVNKSIHTQIKNLNICSQDLHDFLIPDQIKQSRSPSDMSLPYKQFIDRLNEYISIMYSKIPQPFATPQSLYIPFHTQYDLVTFEKLSQFLDEYTFAKYHNNNVKDIYTRMEISIVGFSSIQTSLNHKRITIEDFKRAYQWKKPEVRNRFQALVKRCNRWGTCITYWEFYWLKNTPQFKQFQKCFNSD